MSNQKDLTRLKSYKESSMYKWLIPQIRFNFNSPWQPLAFHGPCRSVKFIWQLHTSCQITMLKLWLSSSFHEVYSLAPKTRTILMTHKLLSHASLVLAGRQHPPIDSHTYNMLSHTEAATSTPSALHHWSIKYRTTNYGSQDMILNQEDVCLQYTVI